MIPTYKATVVEEAAIITGSTKPTILTVSNIETGTIEGKYVVKIFSNQQDEKTAKEFYGNLLAKEFEFNVPECALISVSQGIIDLLKASPRHKNSNLRMGYYYGSKLKEGHILNYTEGNVGIIEDWEIENIFGFDALIFNNDRRYEKPNLFFTKEKVFLIDHELAFNASFFEKPFAEIIGDKTNYSKVIDFRSEGFERKHLFLDFLRAKNKKEVIEFDTFNQSLKGMNLDCLSELKPLLTNAGINVDNIDSVIEYFEEAKKNSEKFVKLLKSLL